MITPVGLADGVFPPVEHGDEDAQQPDEPDDGPVAVLVKPEDDAREHDAGRYRADERPWIRLYEMVVMVLRRGHLLRLPSLSLRPRSSERPGQFPQDKMCS